MFVAYIAHTSPAVIRKRARESKLHEPRVRSVIFRSTGDVGEHQDQILGRDPGSVVQQCSGAHELPVSSTITKALLVGNISLPIEVVEVGGLLIFGIRGLRKRVCRVSG